MTTTLYAVDLRNGKVSLVDYASNIVLPFTEKDQTQLYSSGILPFYVPVSFYMDVPIAIFDSLLILNTHAVFMGASGIDHLCRLVQLLAQQQTFFCMCNPNLSATRKRTFQVTHQVSLMVDHNKRPGHVWKTVGGTQPDDTILFAHEALWNALASGKHHFSGMQRKWYKFDFVTNKHTIRVNDCYYMPSTKPFIGPVSISYLPDASFSYYHEDGMLFADLPRLENADNDSIGTAFNAVDVKDAISQMVNRLNCIHSDSFEKMCP